MDDFHDVRFPLHLAFGSNGGPRRPTEILDLANGTEVRNSRRRHSRRQYNAVAGLKSESEATELLHFYESRRGPLFGFRFKDPLDFMTGNPVTGLDMRIGIGDGDRTSFQLSKTYGDAEYAYVRPISKPVEGSVLVAVNGEQITVEVDHKTGLVTFDSPPDVGAIITAGFEFDVPVRFASEAFDVVLDDFGATQIQDVPLIEILPFAETENG